MTIQFAHLAFATVCLFTACATTQDTSLHRVSGNADGATAESSANDLRDTPALSSTVTLPQLHRNADTTGSSRRIDAVMSPDHALLPSAPAPSSTSPLVGVVPASTQ